MITRWTRKNAPTSSISIIEKPTFRTTPWRRWMNIDDCTDRTLPSTLPVPTVPPLPTDFDEMTSGREEIIRHRTAAQRRGERRNRGRGARRKGTEGAEN